MQLVSGNGMIALVTCQTTVWHNQEGISKLAVTLLPNNVKEKWIGAMSHSKTFKARN